MKFALVSTTNYILLVDVERKKVSPIENYRGEYYGISWFAGGEDIVLSHSGLNGSDLKDIATYAQSEVGWISSGFRNSSKFLSAPHQIICAPDGRVVCANTGRNVITAIDLNKPGLYQEVGRSEARWDRLSLDNTIGDHLNSVFIFGGKLFAIAHRFDKGSMLCTFSYPDMELINVESLGAKTGLHNIWVTSEGQRISCHSEQGSLIDLDAKSPLWDSGSQIYTRGLAASKEYVLIGESQKTSRTARQSSMGGLWIIDRQTWQAVDHICLGPYGAVNEVRLLDVPDEAHHGILFAGLNRFLEKEDMLGLTSKERLANAKVTHKNRHLWSGFQKIFGSPEYTENGALRAGAENICLVIRNSNISNLSFNYNLEAVAGASDAHVAAVLGYNGTGGDTDMVALLLQRSGPSGASLAIWRHDGKAWAQLQDALAYNLPLRGYISLRGNKDKAVLKINRSEVFYVRASSVGLSSCDYGLGIRWIGASIEILN